MKGLTWHLALLLLVAHVAEANNHEELKLVLTTFRGGTRTPFDFLPGTEGEWEHTEAIPAPERGALTIAGRVELETLGVQLRSRYAEKLGVGDSYSPSKVRMRATDNLWSQLSAQSVLNGIFSPAQPGRSFVVHVNMDDGDLLLLAPRNCPAYQSLKDTILFSAGDPQWQALQRRAEPLLRTFQREFALPPSEFTLSNWDRFFDALECTKANSMDPPGRVSAAQIDETFAIANALESLAYPPQYAGLVGGNLALHLLELMEEVVTLEHNHTQWWDLPPKWHLFSGHRETLSSLFTILRQRIKQVPAFAQELSVELYSGDEFFVRVSTGGTYVNACGPNATYVNDGCTFQQFAAGIRAQVAADWDVSCKRAHTRRCIDLLAQNNDTIIQVGSPVNNMWYVLSSLSALLIFGVAVLVFWKWKVHRDPEELGIQMTAQSRGTARRPLKRFSLE